MPVLFPPSKSILACLLAGLVVGSFACSSDSGGPVEPPRRPPPSAQWRWMAPVAEGISLTDIWGPAADSLFATGSNGIVMRYDGAAWRKTSAPTPEPLNAVWGTSGHHVIVVGGINDSVHHIGVVLRFNGSTWTQTLTIDEPLIDVWGANANDVFAVGARARSCTTTVPTGRR